MTTNRVSAVLSSADRDAVMAAVETIKAKLPFLISLTTEDRKALPKAGDRNRGFILNSLEVAHHHSDCLPRSFDIEEMQKDVQLMEDLYPVLLSLSQLHSIVSDTYLAANCEAYTAALKVYDYAKANHDLPGMKIAIERLKQQFVRRNRKGLSPSPSEVVTSALA